MRRAARPLLYAGVLVVVFGLAQIHARYIGHYSFTGTFRFGWTIAYAGILCVCAYGFGLPEVPRTKRAMLGSAVGAAFTGAAAISLVQLFVGDALLPRFVVRSEEHTSELQSLMRISYAVFCLKKKKQRTHLQTTFNQVDTIEVEKDHSNAQDESEEIIVIDIQVSTPHKRNTSYLLNS